jgi:hypothetical protein
MATHEIRAVYHDGVVRVHNQLERITAENEKEKGGAGRTGGGGPGIGSVEGVDSAAADGGTGDVTGGGGDGAAADGGGAAQTSTKFAFYHPDHSGIVKDLISADVPNGVDTGPSIPSAQGLVTSILDQKGKRKQVLKAAREVEISENIKGHLNAIATALVDDMTYELRKEVAKDPRIQARCIKPRRQLEKEIIRNYQKMMSEKRKDKLSMFNTASTLALSGLSTAAYCAIRAAMQKLGGRGMLPSLKAMREARKELEKLASEDLKLYATPDGWFGSVRANVEMEISRMMQVVNNGKGLNSSKGKPENGEAGGRLVGILPDGHGWQDHFHIKIALDARRITRRTSQTEVMLIILPKGQEGVDRCQKAVYQRTIGVWTGKDSRDNVQANMKNFFEEIELLEREGVVFCPEKDSLLGIWDEIREKGLNESSDEWKERKLRRVRTTFWLGADMAAQCAVLGHGCAGNEYCGHCMAHRGHRHIPYELKQLESDISFRQLAEDYDMFPSTLYAINACMESQGGPAEHGLRASTMDATFEEDVIADDTDEVEPGPEEGGGDVADTAGLRRAGRKVRGRAAKRTVVRGVCKGPHVEVLKKLTGWKDDVPHENSCSCAKCVVPAGTVVRVIPRSTEWRRSEWLEKFWPSYDQKRFPFCALHCLMRVTEAMFMMITQQCLKNEHVIDRLNKGLSDAGICKQFSKVPGATGVHTYEKLTFEGHQALKLLAEGSDGKMAVTRILESMWPSGDTDTDGGRGYVPRQVELWKQWSRVVELMTERDPEKVRAKDGFTRFGKECREFCRQYQTLYHEQHCRSFYLHTLMHHAGDFMRELQRNGMCLGMMSNSGVERRHEYGRRAAKKALAGGCWRSKVPGLADKENLFAYLTLKEILIWQHGTDLVSHELAMRAAGWEADSDGDRVVSRRALNADRSTPTAASMLAAPGHTGDEAACDDADEAKRVEELKHAFAEDADISVEHEPPSILVDVDYEGGQLDCDLTPAGVKSVRGRDKYVIEDDTELFKGRDELWQVLPQESAAGSDEFEDEDAEEMASRIKDLDDLRGDWLPEGDDEARARRAKDMDDLRGKPLPDVDDDDDDYCPEEDSDSACSESDRLLQGPRPAAIQRKQRPRTEPTTASTTPAAGSAVRGEGVRDRIPPAESGSTESGAAAVPGPPNGDGGSQPAFLYRYDLLKLKKVGDLRKLCKTHHLASTGIKDVLALRLANIRPGTDVQPPPQPPPL